MIPSQIPPPIFLEPIFSNGIAVKPKPIEKKLAFNGTAVNPLCSTGADIFKGDTMDDSFRWAEGFERQEKGYQNRLS